MVGQRGNAWIVAALDGSGPPYEISAAALAAGFSVKAAEPEQGDEAAGWERLAASHAVGAANADPLPSPEDVFSDAGE